MRCCDIDVEWNVQTRTELTNAPDRVACNCADLRAQWAEIRRIVINAIRNIPEAYKAVSDTFARLDAHPLRA